MVAIIVWLSFDGTFRVAVGERRRGDGDSVIAEISCCRVPTILAPDQAVGILHRDGGCGSRSLGDGHQSLTSWGSPQPRAARNEDSYPPSFPPSYPCPPCPSFHSLRTKDRERSVASMSSNAQATSSTSSTSNIQLITDALVDYTKITGIDLSKNPFAAAIERENFPEAILELLQEREKAFKFNNYRDGNRRLIKCLAPAVNVIQAFSGILSEAVSPVSHTCHLVTLLT
jgi:hypothetical protein